jgi:hypothetical protein
MRLNRRSFDSKGERCAYCLFRLAPTAFGFLGAVEAGHCHFGEVDRQCIERIGLSELSADKFWR